MNQPQRFQLILPLQTQANIESSNRPLQIQKIQLPEIQDNHLHLP